ncbi:hypothetical protein [Thiohalospira sp.]|uniref:hypothetical protein n=1 Tax=Thiohalospira sp. TaxID=3080549 RepID=UPI003980AD59
MRRLSRALPLLALLMSPAPALAGTGQALEERVESLEERVRQLERALQRSGVEPPQADAGEAADESGPGEVHVDYWLGEATPFEGEAPAPRSSGTTALSERFTLDPEDFDLPDSGLFSQWRNPARYPVVAAALSGRLVTGEGRHELVVRPQPVAEGGAGRRTRMRIEVEVEGETVLDTGLTDRRAEHRAVLPEGEGERTLTIRVSARGEGVGPSPTGSAVLLRLKPPGAANPRPLADFVVAP